jgi:hypothetical protein
MQHQSDLLSISLSACPYEARSHYRPAPVMLRLLYPVCRKLVGLGPVATPSDITIRVQHKHTFSSVYTSVTQVTLKDIETHVVSVRVMVAFDSRATVFSLLESGQIELFGDSLMNGIRLLKELFKERCSICVEGN